jgi:aminopeptidase S
MSLRTRRVVLTVVLPALVVSACALDRPAPPAGSPRPGSAAAAPSDLRPSEPPTPAASPATESSDPPDRAGPPLTSEALQRAVDAGQIRTGLDELQRIAEAHGGSRADGTPGYEASADYVAERLAAAGYLVTRPTFGYASAEGESDSFSVLADRLGASGAEVVMLGAHLDSASHRAGINDNGSGVMTLLALAERLTAFAPPERTIRFAFWGAEEPGIHGSTAYVAELDSAERERIVAYLNFDMLGSPNYVRFIYDDSAAAPGSAAITGLFADHFDAAGLAWDTFDLSGKSDQAPFAVAGIPTGGVFSGGGELKTDAQASAMGGAAGLPADACDDAACDTTDNISDVALDEMADAIAHALVTLASD